MKDIESKQLLHTQLELYGTGLAQYRQRDGNTRSTASSAACFRTLPHNDRIGILPVYLYDRGVPDYAIQELRDRGWVAKKDIKRSRKGRPVHSYRLARPFSDIIAAIDSGEKARIRKMEAALGRLRTLVRKQG